MKVIRNGFRQYFAQKEMEQILFKNVRKEDLMIKFRQKKFLIYMAHKTIKKTAIEPNFLPFELPIERHLVGFYIAESGGSDAFLIT